MHNGNERSIVESMKALLAQLRGEDATEEYDDGEPYSPWEVDILSVDHNYSTDIMLAVGGPTQFFRVYHTENGEVLAVGYNDSWANPREVKLSESEERELLEAIGWDDLEPWKSC